MRILILLLALAGCAPTKTTFVSKTDLAGAATVERLVVYADVLPATAPNDARQGFTDLTYFHFQETLTKRLGDCGVTSKIIKGSQLATEERGLEALQPTTMLSIEPAGGTQTDVVDENHNKHGATYETLFVLRAVDLATKKETWFARVKIDFASGNSRVTGTDFATSIVMQLRDDGVLTRCPR